jgi:hypothetical protein
MQTAILIVAMIIGTLAFFVLRLTNVSSGDMHRRDRRSGFGASNPYHAVSIEPREKCCLAVESIQSQRFLSDDAPGLPLPDCSVSDCRCKYIHFADRRSGARDRRLGANDEVVDSEFWRLRNRRGQAGRRHTDQQAA